MRFASAGIACCAGMTLFIAGPAAAQAPIGIATSPVGSLNYSLGNALGKVLGDKVGLQARVVPFGGGLKILPSMDAKRFDMAFLSANDTYFAYEGKEDFKGKPTKNIRVVGVTFPYLLSWYVRKDSPYKSITDLKGKKIGIGYTANTAQRRSVLAQMASEGLTEADFDGVMVPHVVRAADDFAQGKIESGSFAIGAGKISEINVKVGGVRYLSLRDTPDALAGLRKLMPQSHFIRIKPEPGLVGVLEPINVQAEDYLVVVGAHVSDDVAYKAAKMLHDNQADLTAIARAFGRYDPKELARDRGVPFHPGAEKYYREAKIWPAK
ncbi:MAG: TAXI family TRAP transporter solute-binding subunit [Hyphomicrobiaceae bacterium]